MKLLALADEKKKNKHKKRKRDAPEVTATVTEQLTDDPEKDDDIDDGEVDNFEKALQLAQEAYDQQKERSGPINSAYARIVDGALR